MPVYRDDLQAPGVVVVSETALTEQGVLEDALLFVLDPVSERVTLTDEHGLSRTFLIPQEARAGDYTGRGLDLQTESV